MSNNFIDADFVVEHSLFRDDSGHVGHLLDTAIVDVEQTERFEIYAEKFLKNDLHIYLEKISLAEAHKTATNGLRIIYMTSLMEDQLPNSEQSI